VIELSGDGQNNGFSLRDSVGDPWANSTEFSLQYSMKYSEGFSFFVELDTSAGTKYVYYTPVEENNLGSGAYVHYGLGAGAMDGEWHSFTRNIETDLETVQSGVTLNSITGLRVRGSGYLDDIKLTDSMPTPTVYEDAEDSLTDGWDIYDDTPGGAAISNVYDGVRLSDVIFLNGSGTDNGYRLRTDQGGPWSNTSQFVLEWSMNFSGDYMIFVELNTSAGLVYIYYTPVIDSYQGAGSYVHYGLGTGSNDGNWHTFTRDLAADLDKAQSGVIILSVNSLRVRGSGYLDDIQLSESMPAEIIYENAEDTLTTGWDIFDNNPGGGVITNEADGDRVIQLSGPNGISDGYRLRTETDGDFNNTTHFFVEWSMKYSEDFMVFVEMETSAGLRYVYYDAAEDNGLGAGTYVRYGLGTASKDGTWQTFTRDLAADLTAAQGGTEILYIKNIKIRGSGFVDDIKLKTSM